ncbi:ribose-5-phosphate isomerase [Exidia glandulosa HHB12029]|uniref:Ribose-5-phosphate isomerase n=1 Tax=Exidia glandulosa HHB12029 TaxID=1314781 RepID=A0A165BQW9_EXIGL|nr:ribose-5-phosphate isomerase [Exidia glandulosa HHB12029]
MSKPLSAIEAAKRLAAYTAVDHHIFPQHRVIGIGSGSTVPYVVERIVAQGQEANRHRVFIPTGFQSKNLIVDAGLVLGDIEQFPNIDVTIDGADEVDDHLNCIKGGGGCQYREKVLAEAATTFVLVADYRKKSLVLGTTWHHGVPLELVPFGYARVLQRLVALGAQPSVTLRMAGAAKAGPVVSDNGNFIVDAIFPEERMRHPTELLKELKGLTGIVEVGLFCGMAKAAYFGNEDGSVTIRKVDGSVEEVAAVHNDE